ncbi:MAG TPA: gliding motility-associated C-terminal domain-containing protein, partial [Bacteroidia bacterium]|nr:gliding motility-associated C-terminal domain-containing protein [Bacteroidia bacterium]
LVVSPAQTNINCFGSANGTAHVTASGGTPAYTYSWNPVPATGQGTASVTGLIPGAYTCTLTDSGGCSITQLFTLTQPALLSDTHNSQNVKCKGGHDGTAGLILSGGTTPYTFSWSPLPPAGQGTPFISGLGSGSYTCFVTDVQGCSLQEIISITEPAALVLNLSSLLPVSCNGLRNGSATLNTRGGTPGYSYSWTPLPGGGQGTPVASGLIAGLYTCQVTDTNSCTALQTILITEPTAMHIVPAQTNITCNNLNNGSAVVHANGGTPAYTWQWSPVPGTGQGTDSAGGMSPGIYTCTVSDGNGCSAVQSFTLTEPAPLQLQVTGLHVALCNAGNNSSAKLSLNGGTPGYVYSWSPIPGAGQGTDSVSGLISGSYICTVKDTNGCINALTVLIAAPPVLNGLASYANPKCNGSSDGTASLVMSGGAPAYSYSWTPAPPFGQGTGHITGLTAGTYVCNVQDTNGCVFMQSVVLTQPPVLISGSSSVPESCLQHNGSITVTPSGGTGPYSFAWTPAGAPAATSTGLTAGVYTCTITDANGCFTTIRDTLVNTGQVPVAGIAASGPTTFCAGGQVLLTANGGGSYQWSNGDTTAVISVTAGGVYTVTVSNACGSSSAQVQILVNPLPSPAISGLKDVCRGDSVLLTASGGTTYSWNPGGQTTASIYVTNAGVYTVSVGNSCGTGTSVFQVNVHAINCVFTTLLDTGTAPLPVSFNDQSLGFPQSWTWNFGTGNTASGPNTVYTFTNGGTYTVTETIVDSFGCTSTFHVVILVTEPVSWIHIPNIFTPNGDGSNDNWFVASNFLAELDVKIYDRWGVAMAELKNPDEVWDGRTMAGMLASDGTYYYILFARGLDGKKYNNTGYLLLLRN